MLQHLFNSHYNRQNVIPHRTNKYMLQLLYNFHNNRRSMVIKNWQRPFSSYCSTLIKADEAWFPIVQTETLFQLLFNSHDDMQSMLVYTGNKDHAPLWFNSHNDWQSLISNFRVNAPAVVQLS